jgi:DNA-binding winged helix-turn-helix (wHTH) protein/TolB-like protein/cytochrome c-type biogenesis protein CcmH/NrfG
VNASETADLAGVVYGFGPYRLDAAGRVLYRDGVPVPLTPKAIAALVVLVERRGQVVSKDELIKTVWPDTFVEENNLAQHVSALRRVLADGAPGQSFIETLPKRGYRFAGEVALLGNDGPQRERPPVGSHARSSSIPWLVAGVVAVALGLAWLTFRSTGQPASAPPPPGVLRLAVLPFGNLGAAADEYFAAGMTDDVTSRLAGFRGMAVVSGTTAANYDRRGKTVRQIGIDLGVDYILEGTVRWAGDEGTRRLRISPRLIRAADDTTVWTERYDASLGEVFAVQTSIAQRIAGALQVVLDPGERQAAERRPTSNTDAYLAYLRGTSLYQFGQADTGHQQQARIDLEQAVAADPGFALAWAALARVYASQYNTGSLRDAHTRELALRAGQKAIELDPTLAEARLGMAQALLLDRNYDAMLEQLRLALERQPNGPEVLRTIGWVEQRRGRWADAFSAFHRALEIDPLATAEQLGILYLRFRNYPEAAKYFNAFSRLQQSAVQVPAAWLRFHETRDVAAARPLLEAAIGRQPEDARARGLLTRLEWFAGRHDRALELVGGMDAAGAWIPTNFRFPAALAAAQVLESQGRTSEARAKYLAARSALQARLAQIPDDYQAEAALGLAFAGLGQAVEALRHGNRAADLLPLEKDAVEGPLYLILLAEIQSRVGRHDAALETLDRVFQVPSLFGKVWLEHDPGFAPLRAQPGYRARLATWPDAVPLPAGVAAPR